MSYRHHLPRPASRRAGSVSWGRQPRARGRRAARCEAPERRFRETRSIPRGRRTVLTPGLGPGRPPAGAPWRLYRRLRETAPRLGLVLGCCGKPSRDLELEERFRGIFGGLGEMLARAGVEEVPVACPSRHGVWGDEGRVRVRRVYEWWGERGIAGARPPEGPVVVHDPGPARFEPGVHRGEMPHREAGSRPLATYCAGCVEALGPSVHSVHLLDVLFPAGGRSPRTFPRRRANRVWLKARAPIP